MLVKETRKKPKEPTYQRTEMLRRLTRDLQLDAQQRLKVNEILVESNERTKILRELLEPELRAESRKAIDDIRGVLRAPQRARFDELLKQRPRNKQNPPAEKRRQNQPAGTNLAGTTTNR